MTKQKNNNINVLNSDRRVVRDRMNLIQFNRKEIGIVQTLNKDESFWYAVHVEHLCSCTPSYAGLCVRLCLTLSLKTEGYFGLVYQSKHV